MLGSSSGVHIHDFDYAEWISIHVIKILHFRLIMVSARAILLGHRKLRLDTHKVRIDSDGLFHNIDSWQLLFRRLQIGIDFRRTSRAFATKKRLTLFHLRNISLTFGRDIVSYQLQSG